MYGRIIVDFILHITGIGLWIVVLIGTPTIIIFSCIISGAIILYLININFHPVLKICSAIVEFINYTSEPLYLIVRLDRGNCYTCQIINVAVIIFE